MYLSFGGGGVPDVSHAFGEVGGPVLAFGIVFQVAIWLMWPLHDGSQPFHQLPVFWKVGDTTTRLNNGNQLPSWYWIGFEPWLQRDCLDLRDGKPEAHLKTGLTTGS